MGGSGKGKQMKSKAKSLKKSDSANRQLGTSISDTDVSKRKNENPGQFKNPDQDKQHMDVSEWKYFTEDQLEQMLVNEFDMMYDKAYEKLVALGYEWEVAQKAIVRNGHGFGFMNLLSNIVINSYLFLVSGRAYDESPPQGYYGISDRANASLETTLACIRNARPDLKRCDAMKHLLATNRCAGTTSSLYSQSVHSARQNKSKTSTDGSSGDNAHNDIKSDCGLGDISSLNTKDPSDEISNKLLEKDLRLPKRFNLSPDMELLLKKNVETIAAMYHPELGGPLAYAAAIKHLLASTQPDSEDSDLRRLVGCSNESSIEEWLEQKPNASKNALILDMFNHYNELKKQVTDNREWACGKAIQVGEKLSLHCSELKFLRMDKLVNKDSKTGKQVLQEKHMERNLEIESALWDVLSQLEAATSAVSQLGFQSSEILTETDAYDLSTSESRRSLREVEKRERKWLKKIEGMEKEKHQLLEQIENQKQKELQMSEELLQLNKDQEQAEAMLRAQLKGKECAIALAAEEDKLRKAAEASLRSKQTSLHQKRALNNQRHEDDMRRLESELAALKTSINASSFEMAPTEQCVSLRDSIEEDYSRRACIVCLKMGASVLYLPCAHQIVCWKCDEKVGPWCPCCDARIEQRVRIFGTTS